MPARDNQEIRDCLVSLETRRNDYALTSADYDRASQLLQIYRVALTAAREEEIEFLNSPKIHRYDSRPQRYIVENLASAIAEAKYSFDEHRENWYRAQKDDINARNLYVRSNKELSDATSRCDNCKHPSEHVTFDESYKSWNCYDCIRLRNQNIREFIDRHRNPGLGTEDRADSYPDMFTCIECGEECAIDEFEEYFDRASVEETSDLMICVCCRERQKLPWVRGGVLIDTELHREGWEYE